MDKKQLVYSVLGATLVGVLCLEDIREGNAELAYAKSILCGAALGLAYKPALLLCERFKEVVDEIVEDFGLEKHFGRNKK